ncbi:MAG TPA: hypothetical protein VGT40_14875 [Methylomirabilota bacterium]|jgi:hypothetical protein|nr:hypothetical protein [Methylomirabilota bacterium]
MSVTTVNPPNLWRLETPGHAGWPRAARPGDPRKYFIVSADTHVNEPATLWLERTMAGLTDGARAKILGVNAARFFGFDGPASPPGSAPPA